MSEKLDFSLSSSQRSYNRQWDSIFLSGVSSIPSNSEGSHFLHDIQRVSHNSLQPLRYQIAFFAGLLIIIILFPNSYKGRTKEESF